MLESSAKVRPTCLGACLMANLDLARNLRQMCKTICLPWMVYGVLVATKCF